MKLTDLRTMFRNDPKVEPESLPVNDFALQPYELPYVVWARKGKAQRRVYLHTTRTGAVAWAYKFENATKYGQTASPDRVLLDCRALHREKGPNTLPVYVDKKRRIFAQGESVVSMQRRLTIEWHIKENK